MSESLPELAANKPRKAARDARLKRRYRAERRFRAYGVLSVVAALCFLAVLFVTIIGKGYSAFTQTEILLAVNFDPAVLGIEGAPDAAKLPGADYDAAVKTALRAAFPDVSSRDDKRDLYEIMSSGASYELRALALRDPSVVGTARDVWLPASDHVDVFAKGHISVGAAESERKLSDKQIAWVKQLRDKGAVAKHFNTRFFLNGDSREPEQAGILGAVVGSFLTLIVTLILAFPIGVMAAVYLEEFAPKNRWTDLIEVNINNLAAVPSIVFGLLGLAVFINFFGLPRSAPLVGGMVLALLVLPTIIIAGRAALKSVPPSIREAALGIGASHMQMIAHHVLPVAMPGILTGTIIGMAHALGESAPLLMVGMVAFVVDVPHSILDPATVLPVQVYMWADSPERAFVERTSAAIMMLLVFLFVMNSLAIFLRHKFERRW
ncbi:MAG TPA: phosphate ABC transporter permease PstA [Alphaproteobacteria bacterium]|jgi:phosphate transport system permease protein|nr:phosphate ABC transporter permease PstA [Alphaproteobacteria bacterium]